VRRHNAPGVLATRAQIVLLAGVGVGVRATVSRLRLGRATVQRWRQRWSSSAVAHSVLERLVDAPRPGTPPTFTPEQICGTRNAQGSPCVALVASVVETCR